jgi:hypothetical protein
MTPPSQQDVIAFLSDPSTHDGQRPERVETHGAMIFLLPDRVLKLKRDVAYSFMDFGTPEKRRAACLNEVALNRRTAPDLYCGTLPIVADGDGGDLYFGPPDTWPENAVETVLTMRRFDNTLADVSPSDEELTELAEAVASFHEQETPLTGHGGGAAMAGIQEGNLVFLDRDGHVDPGLCDALGRAARAMLDRVAPRIDRRAADGAVRHCHGDLHLANVCRWHEHPVPFDCIEFNDSFAQIDTLYDLAFLLMDLDRSGRRDGAGLVLNRYLEIRPDEIGALDLLPLYLSMRAQVRGKVGLAAADLADDEAAARQRSEAVDFLTRALEYLSPAPPMLVAVGGPSGSGKSTLARRLAPHIGPAPGAFIARSDAIRKHLYGDGALTDALPKSAYSTAASVATYAEMEHRCATALGAGHAAIADATFTHANSRARMIPLAAAGKCRFVGFWLDLDLETAKSRVAARQGDASDADIRVVEAQFRSGWGRIDWHRIDATLPLDDQVDACLAVIGKETR